MAANIASGPTIRFPASLRIWTNSASWWRARRVRIGQHGYEPARIGIPAQKQLTLAITRDTAPNCGAEIVLPKLGIRKALPPGETTLIDLPPQPAGEIAFSCGMGMYRGMIVVR